MAKHAFEKFMNKAASGAKKKEAIRQEKRKAKQERREKFEERNRNQDTRSKYQEPKFKVEKKEHLTSNFQHPTSNKSQIEQMPLNKFIAHAGVCARREAAELVKQGKVQVNGSVIHEPGSKVSSTDNVQVNGKQVFLQKNLVYILINKPKDYITTAKDPEGRKTVFELIKHATKERVYPVGRLDRNTTGVLIMTNDGELAQKLTHPSFEVKKI